MNSFQCDQQRRAGINRNILECKGKRLIDNTPDGLVLIETYWNVKKPDPDSKKVGDEVLIETYWNVKFK